MEFSIEPGIYLVPMGTCWENSFLEAEDFLRQGLGTVLLGNRAKASARIWLENGLFTSQRFLFGNPIQDFSVFLDTQYRDFLLRSNKKVRQMNAASSREWLRSVLKAFDMRKEIPELTPFLAEESFFSALYSCVEELREAGLTNSISIERAREHLEKFPDQSFFATKYFWNILNIYNSPFFEGEESYVDNAAKMETLLREDLASVGPLFLLGFDYLPNLQCQLIQMLARNSPIYICFSHSDEELREMVRMPAFDSVVSSHLFFQGILGGFTGKVEVLSTRHVASAFETSFMAIAHSPTEEARAVSNYGWEQLRKHKNVNFIFPKNTLDHPALQIEFEKYHLKKIRESNFSNLKVAQLFVSAIQTVLEDFALNSCLNLAHHLFVCVGKFESIPGIVGRKGIRGGMAQWRVQSEKLLDPEFSDFVSLLEKLQMLFPRSATAIVYSNCLYELDRVIALSVLAKDRFSESEAHACVGGIFKFSALLASSTSDTLTLEEWLIEMKALLQSGSTEPLIDSTDGVSFFDLLDWIPPNSGASIAMGLNSQVVQAPANSFLFHDKARRALSEFQLQTQNHNEMDLARYLQILKKMPDFVASVSEFSFDGKEDGQFWALDTWPRKNWPIFLPNYGSSRIASFENEFKSSKGRSQKISPSLLDVYKECAFKAYVKYVQKIEDSMQPSSIDISAQDEGKFVHKVLEIFYSKFEVLKNTEEVFLGKCLDESMSLAIAELKPNYYKGSSHLFESRIRQIRKTLWEFIEEERGYRLEFPHFDRVITEKVVRGSLGGDPWTGKVDRIDVDTEKKRYLVVDYKLGSKPPTANEIRSLRKFQLPLYLEAVGNELTDFEPVGALYASVKTAKRNQGILNAEFNMSKKPKDGRPRDVYFKFLQANTSLFSHDQLGELSQNIGKEAERLIQEVREGNFSIMPFEESDSCSGCEVRPACRIGSSRFPALPSWISKGNESELFAAFALQSTIPPKDFSKKAHFNEMQLAALERMHQFVFVEASAGTGKTTVIVERIRREIESQINLGLSAEKAIEKIRAISFTEKSAKELSHRLVGVLSVDYGSKIASLAARKVSTIHGFCREIIGEFPNEAEVGPKGTLLDERESRELLEKALEDFFLSPPKELLEPLNALLEYFSRGRIEEFLLQLIAKDRILGDVFSAFSADPSQSNFLFPSDSIVCQLVAALLKIKTHLVSEYRAVKKVDFLLDFDDLETGAQKALQVPEIAKHYRDSLSLVLMDEFQDTNQKQREMLETISRPEWANFFVVGDAKQSIYRFRAADVATFQSLKKQASKEVIELNVNYRSRKEIVDFANELCKEIFPAAGGDVADYEASPAHCESYRASGGKVVVYELADAEDSIMNAKARRDLESKSLVVLLKKIVASGKDLKNVALLLRKVSGNEAFFQSLTEAGIPFRLAASRGFFSYPAILDGVAFLRALVSGENHLAFLAFLRSPWVGMKDLRVEEILREQEEKFWKFPEILKKANLDYLASFWDRVKGCTITEIMTELYCYYPMDQGAYFQTRKFLQQIQTLEKKGKGLFEIVNFFSQWSGWAREDQMQDEAAMPEPFSEGVLNVMTIHASKGLEFPIVILADLAEEITAGKSSLRVVPQVGLSLNVEGVKDEAFRKLGEEEAKREIAELKRLLYVAVTRAQEELHLIIPKNLKEKESANSFAHLLNFSRSSTLVVKDKLDLNSKSLKSLSLTSSLTKKGEIKALDFAPAEQLRLSVSEIVDFLHCEAFHERKHLRGWEDRVIDLWDDFEDENDSSMKIITKKRSAFFVTDRYLRKLGLERKDRGTILHRVLERVRDWKLDGEFVLRWLREAYLAHGIVEEDAFDLLLQEDHAFLFNFISSPFGQRIFNGTSEAKAEFGFEWRIENFTIHGAMDRVVRDGSKAILVDYKSSLLEDSLEKYQKQVEIYALVLQKFYGGEVELEAFLVDLQKSQQVEVRLEKNTLEANFLGVLQKIRGSYTAAFAPRSQNSISKPARGRSDEKCLACPYVSYCDAGRTYGLSTQ